MNSQVQEFFLTPKELATILDVTPQTIYRQFKELNIETGHAKGRHRLYPQAMRRYLEAKALSIPKAVVSVHVVKGGVGKTTITHALASRASAYGFKTLMIDLDQQSNLTTSFNVNSRPKQTLTLMDVLDTMNNFRENNPVSIEDVIVKITDYLHIIPSSLRLANFDAKLIQGSENLGSLFESILKTVRDNYDLVFFDCPPSLTRVTMAAHCYSNMVIMPVIPDKWSLDGLESTFDHMDTLAKKYSVRPKLGIVINMYDYRQTVLNDAVIKELREHPIYRDHIIREFISISKQIGNCIAARKNIWSPGMTKYPAIQDLDRLFQSVFNISGWKSNQEAVVVENDVVKEGNIMDSMDSRPQKEMSNV